MSYLIKILVVFSLAFSSLQGISEPVALIIIDMQPFFFKHGYEKNLENQKKTHRILARQRQLIRIAKKLQYPILIVEYEDCGPTHNVLTDGIGNYEHAKTFIKHRDGMFDKKGGIAAEMQCFLDDKGISSLIISGANGGACVRCSISGALARGYQVLADPRAIVDFNFEEFVFPYHYQKGQLTIASEVVRRNFVQPNKSIVLDRMLQNSGTIGNQSSDPLCQRIKDFMTFIPFKGELSGVDAVTNP